MKLISSGVSRRYIEMNIFKYIGRHGIKVLENCELKVSKPTEFNDPFEFCPHVETAIGALDVERKFVDTGFLKNIYRRNRRIRDECPKLDTFLESVRNEPRRWIAFFLPRFSDQNRFLPDDFAANAERHLGVICFSQICDDILMWSHYSDQHRGMVIEFSSNTFGDNLYPVEYATERPRYNPVFDVGGTERLARVTRRKSKHWEYEQELRLLVPWGLTQERSLDNGEKIRTLAVKPENVLRVLLGCTAGQELIDRTKGILSQEKFKHVQLQRMVRHLTDYTLHPVDS